MKALKPTGTNILVKLVPPPQDKLTIAIPEQFRPPVLCGVVTAVGPGTEDVPMEVAAGQNVVLPRFGGTELDLEDGQYRMISQEEFANGGLLVEA